jgi:hypothetical protein
MGRTLNCAHTGLSRNGFKPLRWLVIGLGRGSNRVSDPKCSRSVVCPLTIGNFDYFGRSVEANDVVVAGRPTGVFEIFYRFGKARQRINLAGKSQ